MPNLLRTVVFAVALVICGRPEVTACELTTNSPWVATEPELVASTAEIFIGRALASRNGGDSRRRDQQFEIVEPLKGQTPDRTIWLGPFHPATPSYVHLPESRGRVGHGADCGMVAAFVVGQTYLVFRDAFHPRGYELVTGPGDPWVAGVRRLIRSTTAGAPADDRCRLGHDAAVRGTGVSPPAVTSVRPDAGTPKPVHGLELTIRPTKTAFAFGEPLAMAMTFRNVSSEALRLPGPLDPADPVLWLLNVGDAAGDGRCTGVGANGTAWVEPREFRATVLGPGEAREVVVTFRGFGFVDDERTYGVAAHALARHWRGGTSSPNGMSRDLQIGSGAYDVSVTVQFRAFTVHRSDPGDVRAATERLARDPVPLWTGERLRSHAVRIVVTPDTFLPPTPDR